MQLAAAHVKIDLANSRIRVSTTPYPQPAMHTMPAGQILLLGCPSLGSLSADEHPNANSHPAKLASHASPRGPVALAKGVPTPVHYVRASLPHLILCLLCGLVRPIYAQVPVPSPEGIEFFETHIRPVLVAKCYECHSGTSKKIRAGLRLDTAERMRAGGESGPAVVPNKPDESLLVSASATNRTKCRPAASCPMPSSTTS